MSEFLQDVKPQAQQAQAQEGVPTQKKQAPAAGRPDFSQFEDTTAVGCSTMDLNDPKNANMMELTDIVPPKDLVKGEPHVNILLKGLTKSGASDLHLNYNVPPILRIHGVLKPVNIEKYFKVKELTPQSMKKILYDILNPAQRKLCDDKIEVDACYDIPGIGRYRMNIYHQLHGLGAVFRAIPVKIQTIQEVGLSKNIAKLGLYTQGFIIVTGATGSGKSTTLAAMIDYINKNVNKHIVTIEDPLEFVHKNHKSLITHREVGNHSPSFATALRAALRQDPDVILLGELRDMETIEIALTAAETGHLVLGTLHTNNASETISRIISVFPADRQGQISMQLSTVLTAVISQELLPNKTNDGRVPIREILVGTSAVRAMIRDLKIPHLYSAIEMGQKVGMKTMKDSVVEMEEAGRISPAIAKDKIDELLTKQ